MSGFPTFATIFGPSPQPIKLAYKQSPAPKRPPPRTSSALSAPKKKIQNPPSELQYDGGWNFSAAQPGLFDKKLKKNELSRPLPPRSPSPQKQQAKHSESATVGKKEANRRKSSVCPTTQKKKKKSSPKKLKYFAKSFLDTQQHPRKNPLSSQNFEDDFAMPVQKSRGLIRFPSTTVKEHTAVVSPSATQPFGPFSRSSQNQPQVPGRTVEFGETVSEPMLQTYKPDKEAKMTAQEVLEKEQIRLRNRLKDVLLAPKPKTCIDIIKQSIGKSIYNNSEPIIELLIDDLFGEIVTELNYKEQVQALNEEQKLREQFAQESLEQFEEFQQKYYELRNLMREQETKLNLKPKLDEIEKAFEEEQRRLLEKRQLELPTGMLMKILRQGMLREDFAREANWPEAGYVQACETVSENLIRILIEEILRETEEEQLAMVENVMFNELE